MLLVESLYLFHRISFSVGQPLNSCVIRNREGGKSYIGLVLKCENDDENQSLLEMLDFKDEILEIYRNG